MDKRKVIADFKKFLELHPSGAHFLTEDRNVSWDSLADEFCDPPIYGCPPVEIGKFDIVNTESMYYLYLPIKKPAGANSGFYIPQTLRRFESLIWASCKSIKDTSNLYVYITVKSMWVEGNCANRPGWHSDGFMSNDINFIWSDVYPTEFAAGKLTTLPQDHEKALGAIEDWAFNHGLNRFHGAEKTLYRLDQSVIHRVQPNMPPCFRNFVKISFSEHPYNLIGNSINPELPLGVEYAPRKATRNCPIGAKSAG